MVQSYYNMVRSLSNVEGILPKGPYLPCVSMAGRALLAGYHRYKQCTMRAQCRCCCVFKIWFGFQLFHWWKIYKRIFYITLDGTIEGPNTTLKLACSQTLWLWPFWVLLQAFEFNVINVMGSFTGKILLSFALLLIMFMIKSSICDNLLFMTRDTLRELVLVISY